MCPIKRNGVALLVLVVLAMGAESAFLTHKTWVHIRNDIQGTDLTIHCKSKNDDLGDHVLAPGQDFRFHFYPLVFGYTLFFCSFRWNGEFQWFNIYREERDYKRCFDCLWSIRPTGPCLLNRDTNQYDLCEPWNVPHGV